VTFAVLNLCYKSTNQIEFYRVNGMYGIISSPCYQRKNGETFAKSNPCVNPSFRAFKTRVQQQGLGRDALEVWEDFLGQAPSASVNQRPMLNKIQQRIAHLRIELTPQDRGFSVAPVPHAHNHRLPKTPPKFQPPSCLIPVLGTRHHKTRKFLR
jgi:hypothetical protein